MLPKL